jgi:hypothetical protein
MLAYKPRCLQLPRLESVVFQVGQNFLTINLYNFTDPSGVDFKATITFAPEPSSLLLVGASLLGGLFVFRKRPGF